MGNGSGDIQRRLEEINYALHECWLRNVNYAIILVCIFWNVRTVVWTDLLAFFCVLHVPSKGSEECTEACSCHLQQLNLFGSLFIRSGQGLASLQYLGGGRQWMGRQTGLSSSATSHLKLHLSSFLSFLTITCVALPMHFPFRQVGSRENL